MTDTHEFDEQLEYESDEESENFHTIYEDKFVDIHSNGETEEADLNNEEYIEENLKELIESDLEGIEDEKLIEKQYGEEFISEVSKLETSGSVVVDISENNISIKESTVDNTLSHINVEDIEERNEVEEGDGKANDTNLAVVDSKIEKHNEGTAEKETLIATSSHSYDAVNDNYLDEFTDSEDEVEITEVKEIRDVNGNIKGQFEDDELIEYVGEEPFKEKEEKTVVSSTDNTGNNRGFKALEEIPVYFDFCELCGGGKNLDEAWLKDEIRVGFDFMKLFKPACLEDELYSEFNSIFDFDECISLKFSDVFQKIAQFLSLQLRDVNIHLTFGDLNNLTLESDSVMSNNLRITDLLETYRCLKDESPNSDLYKFLSVRVWCTRSLEKQLQLLHTAKDCGFKLENINDLGIDKRKYSELVEDTRSCKRPKL